MAINEQTKQELQRVIALVQPGGRLNGLEDYEDERALQSAGMDITYYLTFGGENHIRRQAMKDLPARVRLALQSLLGELSSLSAIFRIQDGVGVAFRDETSVDDREQVREFVGSSWAPQVSRGFLA